MAATCMDFKWLGFWISDPIPNPEHIVKNVIPKLGKKLYIWLKIISLTFDCKPFTAQSFGAVFLYNRLETLQRSRLQVHVEASTLKLSQFDVVQQTVIVTVANLEDPR